MPPQLDSTTGFVVNCNMLKLISEDPNFTQLNSGLRKQITTVIEQTGPVLSKVPESERETAGEWLGHYTIRRTVAA